ncbi:MAG: hypothetical protein U0Z44_06030 [Kouleothrix sp.]
MRDIGLRYQADLRWRVGQPVGDIVLVLRPEAQGACASAAITTGMSTIRLAIVPNFASFQAPTIDLRDRQRRERRHPPPARSSQQHDRAGEEQQRGSQPEQAHRLGDRRTQLLERRQVECLREAHQVNQAMDCDDQQ